MSIAANAANTSVVAMGAAGGYTNGTHPFDNASTCIVGFAYKRVWLKGRTLS